MDETEDMISVMFVWMSSFMDVVVPFGGHTDLCGGAAPAGLPAASRGTPLLWGFGSY